MLSFRSGAWFSFDGIAAPDATDHAGFHAITLSMSLVRTSMKTEHWQFSFDVPPHVTAGD
tara:strand:+ start:5511 stop:5690 length:180 start_codon:yes stop_codon:yes gene_type:complete